MNSDRTRNVGTKLPNELLLVVLQFADYKTLVLAKLAGAPFLRFITKYAEELARRRTFHVYFFTTCVKYIDVTIGEPPKEIRYEPVNQPSFEAACRELAEVVGPHVVAELAFYDFTMNMAGVGVVFESAPPLKYAENVDLCWPPGWPTDATIGSNNPEAFLHNFAGMKTLRLSLDYNAFRQLSWAFLRKESARDLRLVRVSGIRSAPTGSMNHSIEELVRYCVTLPHLQGGGLLELDFSDNNFSGAFGLSIIEMLKGSGREVTFRMRARQDDGELMRSAVGALSRYSIGGYFITRYASGGNGITVEVKGLTSAASRDTCWVVIQRTAGVPRKPRTSEEVLAVTPFVE